jgi:dynein heavy chain, axonemal
VFADETQLKDPPVEGIYIHGLFLDGASWSNKEQKLVDAPPKVLFCSLPILYVTGVLAKWGWTRVSVR